MSDLGWDGAERRVAPERRAAAADPDTINALQDVHAGIVDVAAAMTGLADALTMGARRQGRLVRVWLGLLTVAILVLCCLGFANYPVIRENKSSSEQIQSCTTPGGECYERNQKNLAAAIAQLNAQTEAIVKEASDQAFCDAGAYCLEGVVPNPGTPGAQRGMGSPTPTTIPPS